MTTNVLTLNFRAMLGRAYPRVIGMNREPSWVIFDTLMPIISIAAFVYVYRAAGAPREFEGFVILGGAMIAFWMNVLWSMAAQFYWEKESGNLQLYLMAPMSRMAVLAGMAVGGMFATTVRAMSTLLVGIVLFQVPIQAADPFLLAAVFIVSLVALYGMGMVFASVYLLYGREAWHTSNLLQEPIFLASGFYFPARLLVLQGGLWVGVVISVLPVTFGLDGLRQLLFPRYATDFALIPDGFLGLGLTSVQWEILFLALLAVVFLGLAHRSLAYMERLAKREGRLTLRHQ